MCDNPGKLYDIVLHFVSEKVVQHVNHRLACNEEISTFADAGIILPYFVSDYLLAYLCDRDKLNDKSLKLFDSKEVHLRHVKIKDSSINPLTTKGLRILKQHQIIHLEALGMRNKVTVNDLVGYLGEWTLLNLRSLNVTNSSFMSSSKICVVVSLSKLKSLQCLNVSGTEFNRHLLEIIAEDLPLLEHLDISDTDVCDLAPLKKCKSRLRSLSMYNLRSSYHPEVLSVLTELRLLEHLDISDDFSQQQYRLLPPKQFPVKEMLEAKDILPNLRSLNLSGKKISDCFLLSDFIKNHPNLEFLGVCLTEVCFSPMFVDSQSPDYIGKSIKVAGEADVHQLMEALSCFSARANFVQKTLFNLFSLTQNSAPLQTEIVELILRAMEIHAKEPSVQMAGTACLYNLSRGQLSFSLHPRMLSEIVRLTMKAMENFPEHLQLQKNALLTLCCDRILQDVSFNRYHCAKLVMECLCSFEDAAMNRMSVAICSILAAKIPTCQTAQLGAKQNYITKLLSIIESKMIAKQADITMKFTLSALWNLTDESPSTCQMFLDQNGLQLFLNVLHVYSDFEQEVRTQVETKVLGLINNLAEVKKLRIHLMRPDIICIVRDLLSSSQIEVSYFAAGIVSHLVTDWQVDWTVQCISRQDILNDLGKAVLLWDQPDTEMVAYRSFTPFFDLLPHYDAPQVQHWAVWAIQHVCSRNGLRYCPMLISEGGVDKLKLLAKDKRCDVKVVELCGLVIELVKNHKQKESI